MPKGTEMSSPACHFRQVGWAPSVARFIYLFIYPKKPRNLNLGMKAGFSMLAANYNFGKTLCRLTKTIDFLPLCLVLPRPGPSPHLPGPG